ncbi:hypothetical protein ABBQ38_004848 [Trebouxia sp. C0009 RCD-2024]
MMFLVLESFAADVSGHHGVKQSALKWYWQTPVAERKLCCRACLELGQLHPQQAMRRTCSCVRVNLQGPAAHCAHGQTLPQSWVAAGTLEPCMSHHPWSMMSQQHRLFLHNGTCFLVHNKGLE